MYICIYCVYICVCIYIYMWNNPTEWAVTRLSHHFRSGPPEDEFRLKSANSRIFLYQIARGYRKSGQSHRDPLWMWNYFRNWKPWLFSISMYEFTPQGQCVLFSWPTCKNEEKIFKDERKENRSECEIVTHSKGKPSMRVPSCKLT